MLKTDYNIPIFEDTDSADLNKYSTEMANALKTQLNNTSEELKDIDRKIENAVSEFSKPLIYKGSVSTYQELPTMATSGDIYTVTTENKNYIWNGTTWAEYASTLDLSGLINALTNNKSTSTGTNITINNSAEARVEEIDIRGNSVQDGTPTPDSPVEINSCGDNVNLLKLTDGTYSNNGISAVVSNGIITINGTNTEASMITIPLEETIKAGIEVTTSINNTQTVTASTEPDFRLGNYSSSSVYFGKINSFKTYTITTDITNVQIRTSVANVTYSNFVIKPKVEIGTKATPYIPYNQGCINETICNKNLLDSAIDNVTYRGVTGNSDNSNLIINGTSTGSVSIGGDNFKLKAGTYTVSLRYVSGSVNDTFYVRLRSGDTSIKAINKTTSNYTNDVGSTFTLTEETELNLNIYTTVTGIVFNNLKYKIQMVESSTADYDFVERIEQTYTIPTQKPFRAIGDYKDTFVKQNGVWYEKHYIEEEILDGDEENLSRSATYDSSLYRFRILMSNIKYATENKVCDISCNILKPLKEGTTYTPNEGIANGKSDNYIYMYIEECSTMSLDNFKVWLASNNIVINYVLETPELIPCTTEQIIKLNEIQALAKTYKNTTHIYSEDEVSPEIEVTYLKDIATMLGGV